MGPWIESSTLQKKKRGGGCILFHALAPVAVHEPCRPISWNFGPFISWVLYPAACSTIARGQAHRPLGQILHGMWLCAITKWMMLRLCSPCLWLYCLGLHVIICFNRQRDHISSAAVVNNICSVSFLFQSLFSWSSMPMASATPSLLAYSNLG